MASGIIGLCVLATLTSLIAASPQPVFLEDIAVASKSPQRIVSGWEAEEGQIPHQLSIRMVSDVGTVSSCGASIIHNEWGLTAAHCTALRPTIVIRAGLVHLTRPEYIFETTTWFNHPLYIDALPSVVQPHDIALLKFERFIPYTDYIKPIRLQSSEDMNKQYEDERLVASGWGRTWTNGALPEHLNWVYLRGVTNFACWVAFGFNPIIIDSTICARGYNVSSQSTCQGDSGGPLTAVDDDGELTQVGVASFVSSSGCHTDEPAGFIRPGHYHDWITEVTGLNLDTSRPDPTTESPEETTTVETTEVPDSTSTEGSQETTVAPTVTTEVPEETTTGIPESTTSGPVETTTFPEGTTTEGPLETTAAPVETTTIPEESTTEGEQETTTVPEETTTVPEETPTEEPQETTTAPIETTTFPEATPTEGSQETTAAPVETTTFPEATSTDVPQETTTAPEESTTYIPETTAAPEVTPTEAPEELTEDSIRAMDVEHSADKPQDDTTLNKSLWSRLNPLNLFGFM